MLDEARSASRALIGAEPSEIVFTSGGTEADNFALRGVAEALEPTGRRHLIASAIEHEAVLNTLKALARRGWRTTLLPVDATGIVAPDALPRRLIADETALVSVMHANNEIGTIQPIAELARASRTRAARSSTPMRCSRSARFRWTSARSASICCRSRRTSSTARREPARCGSSAGTRLRPILTGGKHERNRRAGTENVAGDRRARRRPRAGAAEAHGRSGRARRAARSARERHPRSACPGTAVNGAREPRVPNTTNISFEGVEAESLLIALDLEGVAVSTGSACSSGTLEPSHVLRAMGLPSHRTQNSIRFSLGAGNTERAGGLLLAEAARGRGEAAEPDAGAGGRTGQIANPQPRKSQRRLEFTCDLGFCGSAVCRTSYAYSRRHVGRRRFVGGRGAARAAGPRGHRSVDAALRPAATGTDALRHAAARSTTCTTRAASPRASASRTTSSISSGSSTSTVISNFVREYAAGRTPIPCVHCNGDLKFATLAERARRRSAPSSWRRGTTRASSSTRRRHATC